MGVNIIGKSLKVPKTVLEDVWLDTLSKLRDNPNFNSELVEKIESMTKVGLINSDDIIVLLKD
jgi:hypothetical protein